MSSAAASTTAQCSCPETAVIITCEHGGNSVPRSWAALFAGCGELLASHRGWDPGALALARELAAALGAPLFYSTNTRLLVDLNRSLHHPRLFSDRTSALGPSQKKSLIDKHYLPFRNAVESEIRAALERGQQVLHLSVHSFTPALEGVVRNAGLGLLYDPRRAAEKAFCRKLKATLAAALPELRVRFNYPYRGVSDGHVTALRRLFPERYAGIEIELNQSLLTGRKAPWRQIGDSLIFSVAAALKD
ncbi:N-formylglutamate amidohydrolase [bacterium]|nr:N-formylglutamate amidohydrolase [bacterium]